MNACPRRLPGIHCLEPKAQQGESSAARFACFALCGRLELIGFLGEIDPDNSRVPEGSI